MARTGRPGTIRGEASRRGVSETQIRVERGRAAGLTPSVAVGKPRRGEVTLTESRKGILRRRSPQPKKYRQWWVDQNGNIRATVDTNRIPDASIGDQAWPDPRYPSQYLILQAITVSR